MAGEQRQNNYWEGKGFVPVHSDGSSGGAEPVSAIFGVWHLDGKLIARAEFERMSETLVHRGPDESNIWINDNIGMGHHMLWTTPESLVEFLPFEAIEGGAVITADARIDNRYELINKLGLNKRSLQPITDSEIILSSYQRWGQKCAEKLVGDFVFAIWDRQTKSLFCARDHIGVKCLYYHLSDKTLAFATEIKALLSLSEVPRQLNESRVADFLIATFEDRTSTFYKGIVRLPAAHTLTVTKNASQLKQYWSLDASRSLRLRSDDEYAEAFGEVFNTAVRCRIRSAYPVGSTLSGGLDSSSIACTARDLLKKQGNRLHTFSAIFPGLSEKELRKIDERRYIEAVISQGGFDPFYLRADLLSPLCDFDKVLWHGDEVNWGPNLYIHWGLYNAAKERNVRILLDGLDGDTTVSHGLGFLTELAWTGRWRKLFSEAKGLAKVRNAYSARRIIWEYGFKPLIPKTAVRLWHRLMAQQKNTTEYDRILNRGFARKIKQAEGLRDQSSSARSAYTSRRSHFQSLNFALHPYTLELADKAAGAFGLEARFPFYDRRLMEFCLALPADQKLRDGWTRAILRRAMTGILPPAVRLRRDKANLSPNFTRKFFEYEGERIKSVLEKKQTIAKYVDADVLKNTYSRCVSQTRPNSSDALTIYRIVALSLWLQKANFT